MTPTKDDALDKWEPLKISNGYQYPAQSGEYIVRMIDGAELRSQYDGRFFRREDNCDKIIPAHEIVCFKAIRAALKVLDEVQSVYAQLPETVLRDTRHRMGAEMYRDHLKQIAGE